MQGKSKKIIIDYYNLGLSKTMISNLNLLKNEINDIVNSKNDVSNNIESLINYYIDVIAKEGINVTRKKLSLNKINELDETYVDLIETYKYEQLGNLMNYVKDTNEKIDIINMIMFYCIKLYKHSQLIEFKINNINNINLIAKNDCCALCVTKSKFKNTTDELIEDIHPFCNDSYNLYVNEKDIKSFIKKMKIMIPQYIKDVDMEFVDNININDININDEDKKSKLNSIVDDIISYQNDKLIIKKEAKDIYHILLLNIFNFDFDENILNWFKEKYMNMIDKKTILNDIVIYKKPFISFMAEIDYNNYLIESIIYYILDGKSLQAIDEETFNYIKTNIFNNLEFR